MTTPVKEFKASVAESTKDFEHRRWMQGALHNYENVRAKTQGQFADWSAAREEASAIKWHALENLPELLESFVDKLDATLEAADIG